MSGDLTTPSVWPSARGTASAPQFLEFRGSIPGLHVPLPTLGTLPHDRPPMARGRYGSPPFTARLLPSLHLGGLSRRFPTFTADRSTGEAPSFSPAASPWVRRRPSPWPPRRPNSPTGGVTRASTRMCTATRPISTRLEPVLDLRGFDHWFLLSYAFPSRLPDPNRLVVPTRPVVVRAASHPSLRPQSQAALSFSGPLRRSAGGVLSSPLGQTAPRGARSAAKIRPSIPSRRCVSALR
jgi:hypothetical protein